MKGLLCKEHSMPRVAHAHKRGVLRQSIEYVVREHPLNLSRLPRSTLPPKLVLATLHEKPERHSCLASSRRPARPGRAGSTMTEQNQKQKHSCFRSRFRCRRFAGSTPYCREMGCSDLGVAYPTGQDDLSSSGDGASSYPQSYHSLFSCIQFVTPSRHGRLHCTGVLHAHVHSIGLALNLSTYCFYWLQTPRSKFHPVQDVASGSISAGDAGDMHSLLRARGTILARHVRAQTAPVAMLMVFLGRIVLQPQPIALSYWVRSYMRACYSVDIYLHLIICCMFWAHQGY